MNETDKVFSAEVLVADVLEVVNYLQDSDDEITMLTREEIELVSKMIGKAIKRAVNQFAEETFG